MTATIRVGRQQRRPSGSCEDDGDPHCHFEFMKKQASVKEQPKANFLWPHHDGSVEEAGYEFANAHTEAYRQEWWRELLRRLTKQKRA